MALPLPPFNPYQPIPNNPFYSPQSYYLQGVDGPLVIGSGLTINYATSTISSTGGGGGGGGTVTSIATGAGLQGGPITTSGTISLTDTLPSGGTYTYPTLTVDQQGRITSISNGATPGTVTCIMTSNGITGGPITSAGTLSLEPSGVTAGNYTYATVGVDIYGRVTSAFNGVPPVTAISVTAPITSSGSSTSPTIALACVPGLVPAAYCYACVCVDCFGRVTAIAPGVAPVTAVTGTAPICVSSGTTPIVSVNDATCLTPGAVQVGSNISLTGCTISVCDGSSTVKGVLQVGTNLCSAGGVVSVCAGSKTALGVLQVGTNLGVSSGVVDVALASTTCPGIVQLEDSTTSCSTSLALTANQGFILQCQINALLTAGGLSLAGTFNASTSGGGPAMLTVTSAGLGNGFAVGSNLPAPAGQENFFVIVTTPGTYSPPGGGGPYTLSQGDWLLSNGTAWQYLNVGYDPAAASTTQAGIVRLALAAEVQTGTANDIAITPAGGEATYLKKSELGGCGYLITANFACTPVALAPGADGTILTVDTTCVLTGGLKWATPVAAGVPCSAFTASGDLLVGTGSSTFTALTISPTTGQVLTVDPTCVATGGLTWTTPAGGGIPCSCLTAAGQIITTETGALGVPYALPVGSDGTILTACSAVCSGLCWVANPAVLCCTLTAKGDLITATAANTPIALPVGPTDGQVLTVCAAAATGLCWASVSGSGIPCSCLTAAGQIITTQAGALGTPFALPVGADNYILVACSAVCPGLCWIANPSIPCAAFTATSQVLVGTGANTYCALAPTSNGQALIADSTCTSTGGLKWALPAGVDATPTVAGAVKGCTNNTCFNTFLGCQAGTAILSGCADTLIGSQAGCALTSGCNNTFIGCGAGQNVTTGSNNVALGFKVALPSATGSSQLALGWCDTVGSTNCYWLTGDSSKNIRPGAGILDCLNTTGNVNQVLKSTGTAIQWSNVGASVGGIVDSAVEVCMDGFAVSMAGGGNKSFGIRTLAAGCTVTASWTNWGFQGPSGITGVGTCNSVSVTNTFQRFDSSYNWTTVTGVQCTVLTLNSPVTATYAIMGVVGNGYNKNTICITRVA